MRANDFIKENKNYRCENFTISDNYDVAMKEQIQKKEHAKELKLKALIKPLTDEQIEERDQFMNVIRYNAVRNVKDKAQDVNKNSQTETVQEDHVNQLGAFKLSEDQLKGIYDLMDKRLKSVSKSELPLGSYVRQLEEMLDQGYQVEYVKAKDVS